MVNVCMYVCMHVICLAVHLLDHVLVRFVAMKHIGVSSECAFPRACTSSGAILAGRGTVHLTGVSVM